MSTGSDVRPLLSVTVALIVAVPTKSNISKTLPFPKIALPFSTISALYELIVEPLAPAELPKDTFNLLMFLT